MLSQWRAVSRLLKSFSYALSGIAQVLRRERNMQIHCVATLVVLLGGYTLQLSANEWCWVTACIAAVWSAELLNTAIEQLTDLVSPNYDKRAGSIKDIAAGAVLASAIGAAVIGAIIFLPKLYRIFAA